MFPAATVIDRVFDGREFTITSTVMNVDLQSGAIQCNSKGCGKLYTRNDLKRINTHTSSETSGSVHTGNHASFKIRFRCEGCQADVFVVAPSTHEEVMSLRDPDF